MSRYAINNESCVNTAALVIFHKQINMKGKKQMNSKIDKYPIPKTCIYCGANVIFTSNAAIYGHEYGNGKCYKCTACDSYVGVHTGTKIPLGRLADKELRGLKKQCHDLFDLAWRRNKRMSREKAYGRLAKKLGISENECHFGWFGKEELQKCVEIMSREKWYIIPPVSKKNAGNVGENI